MNNELIDQNEQETQSLSVSEQARTRGAIEASLTVASARPRNEQRAIAQVATSCQRVRLAESATYTYAKGGTDITGPSISLVVQVALAWGNLDWGYRELSRGRGESTVEAYAWDQQTNARYSRQFIVPHRIRVGGRQRQLREDELSDWIANQAQRRVRTCLENVIPRDVIDEAVDECARTLKANIDLDSTKILAMVEKFAELGVTQEQIAAKLQRSVDAIQPAQYLAMRRIYVAIQDGLQTVSQAFPQVEETKPAEPSKGQQLMEAAKKPPAKKRVRKKPPAKKVDVDVPEHVATPLESLRTMAETLDGYATAIRSSTTVEELNTLADQIAYDAAMKVLVEDAATGLTQRVQSKIADILNEQRG
mgnify:FL=1